MSALLLRLLRAWHTYNITTPQSNHKTWYYSLTKHQLCSPTHPAESIESSHIVGVELECSGKVFPGEFHSLHAALCVGHLSIALVVEVVVWIGQDQLLPTETSLVVAERDSEYENECVHVFGGGVLTR